MIEHGKVAIVTGAGSGVGRATALALLRDGYRVVLAGRRPEMLAAVIAEAGSAARRALAIPTDVSDPEPVRVLFARTRDTFGRLDLLFNNAGTNVPGVLFEELTVEQWQKVVNTNLTGAFLCSREAFRIMKDQDPRSMSRMPSSTWPAFRWTPTSSP